MKGSSRALFQAVVVMGAALACDRSAAPETRPEVAEPVKAVSVEPVKPVVVEPVKPVVEPVAEPARDEAVAVAAPEVAEPKKKAKARKQKDIREKCPEGSEMPYPPCFYIL